jgi:hypothetical protein
MSRGRSRRNLQPSGFTTHVLALAKPPSMLRGRVYDMREEKVGLETHIYVAILVVFVDDCLNEYLFNLKNIQGKEIHSSN